MNTLVKCKCNHCSANIEFEEQHSGQTVQCPHCGLDTLLYVPRTEKKEPQPQKTPPPADPLTPKPPKKNRVSFIGIILLTLCGLGMILQGCFAESEAKSAVQQTVAAIQYCTGILLIGMAFVLDALRSVSKNQ